MSRPQFKNHLTTRQVAALLGVCLRTVQLWSDRDVAGIPFQRTAGGHRRYVEQEVKFWAAQHDVFVTPRKLRSVEDTRKKLRVFLTDVITSEVALREAALELHAMLGTYSRAEALALITEAL